MKIKTTTVKIFVLLALLFSFNSLLGQSFEIVKIEPPYWWVGMKNNSVQLMVYGNNLDDVKVLSDSEFIEVKSVTECESEEYLFVDLEISAAALPGKYPLWFISDGYTEIISYELKKRTPRKRGFSNSDVIYLLMPDRFSNGNTANDSIDGYYDSMQQLPKQGRAGGDLEGVLSKLDYLKEFGITALWMTPLTENNTFRSYHGYNSTNLYKIDPRLGNIPLYKKIADEADKRGIKIIMDHVANHISDDHPWFKNLPFKNWINGTKENHFSANHSKMVFSDIHSDSATIKHVEQGWFVNYMADLNQSDPILGRYIIQNTIWWIETVGISGIREDTYPYCNQKFMSAWAEAVLIEYPDFNIVGEVWTGDPAYLASYQGNPAVPKSIDTHLPSITDFAFKDALVGFLNKSRSIRSIFEVFAKDYLYSNPDFLVTFVDNHDVGRSMFQADTNIARFKIAYQLLLTTRGIPSIFYGTEIGMVLNNDHGTLRKPFPGGFPADIRNAFSEKDRTEYENEIFYYLKNLISLRKQYPSFSKGKMIHFPPENDVYIYLKVLGSEITIGVVNESEEERNFETSKIKRYLNESMVNLRSNKIYRAGKNDNNLIKLSPHTGELFLIR